MSATCQRLAVKLEANRAVSSAVTSNSSGIGGRLSWRRQSTHDSQAIAARIHDMACKIRYAVAIALWAPESRSHSVSRGRATRHHHTRQSIDTLISPFSDPHRARHGKHKQWSGQALGGGPVILDWKDTRGGTASGDACSWSGPTWTSADAITAHTCT